MRYIITLTGLMIMGLTAAGSTLPACPEKIPDSWLKAENHPKLYCSKAELTMARQKAANTEYGKAYLAKQKKLCAGIMKMSDAQLRALVPKPGSPIIYGLGMNICPKGGRFRWAGLDKPFKVYGNGNVLYPNENCPDNGQGWVDPKSGKKYMFVANANGFIHQYLEQTVLPALADAYALTGDKEYAHKAAVLLDAIAAAYSKNRRGPLDYPTSASDYDRGGRLDRPYYQTARGLYNYVNTIDLIANSGELDQKSLSTDEKSIRENIIRNLLWDGGVYCLDFTLKGTQLHNGHADYMRGAGMVGILLDQRVLAEPMLKGPLSMDSMLDVNIDRNGFYVEVSPSYCIHASELYINIAELIEAARAAGWLNVPSTYANPTLNYYLSEFFNRREAGGHMPTIGDDGPDRFLNSPLHRMPGKKYVHSDRFIKNQLNGAWTMLVRGQNDEQRKRAAALLKNSFGAAPVMPPDTRWALYHISPEHMAKVNESTVNPDFFNSKSVFYGAKGLAILRGGEGEKRFAAQLAWGPQNNHGHKEMLSWNFYDRGAELGYDQGYFNTHYRFGWTSQSVTHQMVTVNAQSCDLSEAGGCMTAWLDTPQVQWVAAAHPKAYSKQGVTKYDRFIAQVQNPEDRRLGYWLDVSRVDGGKIRDDSFHTIMTDYKVSTKLTPDKKFSLFGDMYKDSHFQNDYRLSNFPDKPFYWTPPGAGYGFLTHPEEAANSDTIVMTLSKPGFAFKDLNTDVTAFFPGEPARRLIVTKSMKARGAPSVPFVIRRDTGSGISVFAKVLSTENSGQKSNIAKVETIVLKGGSKYARGYIVLWESGLTDLWIISENGQKVTAECSGLSAVSTDGAVAMVRFDSNAKAILMAASGASTLTAAGQHSLSGQPEVKGEVEKISASGDNVAFSVKWSGNASAIPAGAPMLTIPAQGTPATWRIKTAEGGTVIVEGVKPTVGTSVFTPISGNPGWYQLNPPLSRFFTAAGGIMTDFIVGKTIYDSGKPVGIITDCNTSGNVKITRNGKNVGRTEFTGKVMEVTCGEKVLVPLNLYWSSK